MLISKRRIQIAKHPGRSPEAAIPDNIENLLRAGYGNIQQIGLLPCPGTGTDLVVVRRAEHKDHGFGLAALHGVYRAHALIDPAIEVRNFGSEGAAFAYQPAQPV